MTAPARAAAPLRRPTRRPAPARPHLRVVAPPRARRRIRLALVGAVAVTLFLIFGLVAFNVLLVQSQFKLEQLEAQVQGERDEYERLRLEAARLSSPERILQIARRDLGMVDPLDVTPLVAPPSPDEAVPGDSVRAWAEVKPHLAAEP